MAREVIDDPFAEDYDQIAAYARQLMRAYRAKDSKALELENLHLDHYLCHSLLWRHMKRQDPSWEIKRRWFDGIGADPEFPSPGVLRLCGQIAWVDETWYYDPFDMEVELSPTTGEFRHYIIRFGDNRPLSEKISGSAKQGVPVGAWAFVFEKRRAETIAPGERVRQ